MDNILSEKMFRWKITMFWNFQKFCFIPKQQHLRYLTSRLPTHCDIVFARLRRATLVTSRSRSHRTALQFYVQVFQKFISREPHVIKCSYLHHSYPGGSACIPWLLPPSWSMPRDGTKSVFSTFLLCKQLMQIVVRHCSNLMALTCGSWSEGQHDLCFMVQWFCLISWRLFDILTSYYGFISHYDPTFDLKINLGLYDIFHSPVVLPYIVKTVWCINIILWDYVSVWSYVWP